MVENALSLRPRTYVNDAILNFAWKQCSEQYLKGQSKGNLRVCSFPSFFITNLLGEGGEETYNYKRVSTWLQKVFGKDTPPLQYDVIVCLRHQAKHWWTYVMLPKAKHLKGLDSFGMNDQFRNDLRALWWLLNGDLHFHHGLGTLLDGKKWHINANCGEFPRQTNTWDCGLYAIHMGFCCALQAPFTEITPHQIHTYCQKCILYLLDDDKTNDIMLPNCNWHQKVHLQSRYFPGEAEHLYNLMSLKL
jgi:Ulp1 family protease